MVQICANTDELVSAIKTAVRSKQSSLSFGLPLEKVPLESFKSRKWKEAEGSSVPAEDRKQAEAENLLLVRVCPHKIKCFCLQEHLSLTLTPTEVDGLSTILQSN